MPDKFQSHIAGEWMDAETGARYENRNPADTDDLIGTFPACGPVDVERAVESAVRGYKEWSRIPAPKRGEVLKKVQGGRLWFAYRRGAGDSLIARIEGYSSTYMLPRSSRHTTRVYS